MERQTFEDARRRAEALCGGPVEPYGYEGPEQFVLIPRRALWDEGDEEEVVVVEKLSGAAEVMGVDHEVMDQWPLVAPRGRVASRSKRKRK